jgi:hypothetical protein
MGDITFSMKAVIAAIALLVLSVAACNAVGLEYLSIDAGMIFIGNSDPESAPSPIVPYVGVALPVVFGPGGFYLLPRVSVSGTDYLLTSTRPAPAEIENAEDFVLLVFLDLLFGYRVAFSESVEMGFLIGMSGLFRVPIAYEAEDARDAAEYISYFYGNARFLYPATEINVKLKFTRTIGILIGARALWPLFHIWDGEGLPFYDQLIVSAFLGFCIGL